MTTRRKFIGYIPPVVATLAVIPAFVQAGSGKSFTERYPSSYDKVVKESYTPEVVDWVPWDPSSSDPIVFHPFGTVLKMPRGQHYFQTGKGWQLMLQEQVTALYESAEAWEQMRLASGWMTVSP